MEYSRVSLHSYTERGASLGNAVIPDGRYDRLEGTGGLEATFNVKGAIRPSFRVGYTVVDEGGDRSGMVRLIDLAATSSVVTLPNYSKGFVSGEAALEGEAAGFGWRAAVGARDTGGDTSMSASFGISRRF